MIGKVTWEVEVVQEDPERPAVLMTECVCGEVIASDDAVVFCRALVEHSACEERVG